MVSRAEFLRIYMFLYAGDFLLKACIVYVCMGVRGWESQDLVGYEFLCFIYVCY